MRNLKQIAALLAAAGLSACGGFTNTTTMSDGTTYVAPRASLDSTGPVSPGIGAAGGGGGGAGAPR